MDRDDTVKRALSPARRRPPPPPPIPRNLSSNTDWILDNPFMNSVIEKSFSFEQAGGELGPGPLLPTLLRAETSFLPPPSMKYPGFILPFIVLRWLQQLSPSLITSLKARHSMYTTPRTSGTTVRI